MKTINIGMHKKKYYGNITDNDFYCITFKSLQFKLDYIYHNVYYRENRDSMTVVLNIIDPNIKIYGQYLRFYMAFIENYVSPNSEFLTMQEFRSEYNYQNTTYVDNKRKEENTHGKKINSFETYLKLTVNNATLILPSNVYDDDNVLKMSPKLIFNELLCDYRITDEYQHMYIYTSPLKIEIPLTEQESAQCKNINKQEHNNSNKANNNDNTNDINDYYNNISTFIYINEFKWRSQGWSGLPPKYLIYSQQNQIDIGNIEVQLYDCQLKRLIRSLESIPIQYNDSFDSRCYEFKEKETLHKHTFNDDTNEIDYPENELCINEFNIDCKPINILVIHRLNSSNNLYIKSRNEHITQLNLTKGIQFKYSTQSTLEYASRMILNCGNIYLKHLISTSNPKLLKKDKHKDTEASNLSNIGIKIPKNKAEDDIKKESIENKYNLLCIASLESNLQIIYTTERSDQDIYPQQQKNFENKQTQIENDIQMDQDWPCHLLNTMKMQDPVPNLRNQPLNVKKKNNVQQTDLDRELYGNEHKNYEIIKKFNPNNENDSENHNPFIDEPVGMSIYDYI